MSTKARILVVDDEIISLKITRKFLGENGFLADIASSATQAIKMLEEVSYDLALIDITMPTLSGFDLAQMMNSFNIKTPIVFLSVNENSLTREEALNLGAKRVVSKENEFNDLPNIVQEVLSDKSE